MLITSSEAYSFAPTQTGMNLVSPAQILEAEATFTVEGQLVRLPLPNDAAMRTTALFVEGQLLDSQSTSDHSANRVGRWAGSHGDVLKILLLRTSVVILAAAGKPGLHRTSLSQDGQLRLG